MYVFFSEMQDFTENAIQMDAPDSGIFSLRFSNKIKSSIYLNFGHFSHFSIANFNTVTLDDSYVYPNYMLLFSGSLLDGLPLCDPSHFIESDIAGFLFYMGRVPCGKCSRTG